MKMINSRELNINTAKVLKQAGKEDLIVTVKGKPAALIQAFSEDDLEDYILTKLMEKRLKARAKDYQSKGAVSLNEMIEATERAIGKKV
ncbi:type II toxin-antitoxin system prevent-host-death family antitoxin [Candidatus Manganitrophus noduliformans]|uniref:Type II toxin-antitoxin system prevent-host-death family antitoxin n=1 Tax=Candidatus Manganitrophus noduliformans TaxID=2606439 RepID=A0A7X6DPL2_9BACT|nr:type II toxin-antitoxin system prevent-host-death family antitoxin [Candidatus Manganitrophus noduliformans]NKE71011.1 type II toxin-antitoxin system prevent-host-death family antitoxin [Candidatus Manganitrophus noduliformans]